MNRCLVMCVSESHKNYIVLFELTTEIVLFELNFEQTTKNHWKQEFWDMALVYTSCKQCKLSLKEMNILFAFTLHHLYTARLV